MICDHGAVSAHLRGLLPALALACSGLVLTQAPAQAACSCGSVSSIQSDARDADVVFTGVLVKQESGGKLTTYTLDVERIYRGRVADTPVEVVSARRSGGGCGLGRLDVDSAYVVFATRASARLESGQLESGQLSSGECSGTEKATPSYVSEIERVLGPGNEIPQPSAPGSTPATPEYTRVEDADPPKFTRLAAPGGAMVLVGLLGLILFRKRG